MAIDKFIELQPNPLDQLQEIANLIPESIQNHDNSKLLDLVSRYGWTIDDSNEQPLFNKAHFDRSNPVIYIDKQLSGADKTFQICHELLFGLTWQTVKGLPPDQAIQTLETLLPTVLKHEISGYGNLPHVEKYRVPLERCEMDKILLARFEDPELSHQDAQAWYTKNQKLSQKQ